MNESMPGICDVERFGSGGPARHHGPADLLIEVPHGATRRSDFDALRRALTGDYPDDLVDFFFVNTDVGAPECAREIAARLVREDADLRVDVLVGRIPRTFIDCNRVAGSTAKELREGGLTPYLPDYVTSELDRELLVERHAAYHDVADRMYAEVCEPGGRAITLHTYAPRSVDIVPSDHRIVAALREAYRPENYARWKLRPDVELIHETPDGRDLSPPDLLGAIEEEFAAIGVRVARNVTYRLHPGTLGYVQAERFPGRVVCLEINRARLADPFEPFVEMRISPDRVSAMTAPLVRALHRTRARRAG